VLAQHADLDLAKLLAAECAREGELLGRQRGLAVGTPELPPPRPLAARHRVGGPAVQLAKRPVEEREAAVLIAREHARIEALEQGAQELALVLERALAVAATAALLVLLDGPEHGGRETVEPRLQQVVRGAAAQALHGGVLAERARDQDERRVGRESARELER